MVTTRRNGDDLIVTSDKPIDPNEMEQWLKSALAEADAIAPDTDDYSAQVNGLPTINIPNVRTGAPLSVVIITSAKDAETYLPNCLASLPEWAEVVVCHTASAETETLTVVDIDERLITLRYTYTGRFDFGRARNAAKQAARAEWVMHLDADERLIPTQFNRIRHVVTTMPDDCGGIYVTMTGHHDGETLAEKRYAFPIMRLHRNVPAINWVYSIHEQLSPSVKRARYRDADTNIVVLHEGYQASKDEMLDKLDRNLKAMIYQYTVTPNQFFLTKIMQTVLTAYRLRYMKTV